MKDSVYIEILEAAADWLDVVLDQADYTDHACGIMEPVGAVLDSKVLDSANDAVSAYHKARILREQDKTDK